MNSPLLSIILSFAIISAAQAKQIFKSTAVVQVHPAMIAIPQVGHDNPGALMTRSYMENEFETIVAPETLKIAAQTLKIDLKADPEALKNLRSKISTKPRRGTDFIEISAQSDTKEKAKRIVEAVTSAYIKRRTDAELARAKQALAALDQELVAQSELVQENRKELTTLIQKYGIPYFDEPSKAAPSNLKESLAAIEKAKPEDKLALIASIDIPKNPVTPLYKDYLKKLEKLDFLRQTLKGKHPDVIAARKEIATARTKVHDLAETFPAFLKKRFPERVRTKEDSVALSLRQNSYNQAKESYEQSREMLREMKIKQQEARVLLKMPRKPITLHERAR